MGLAVIVQGVGSYVLIGEERIMVLADRGRPVG
jgi:hypothetical protein